MRMYNPPHPGEILRELCLKPKALGVSCKTLSNILNGRSRITPEMSIRLSIAFDTTPESWMNQQMQYDLWQGNAPLLNSALGFSKKEKVA